MRLTKAVLIVVTVLVSGCREDKGGAIDTTSVQLDLRIGRLDRGLFRASPQEMPVASLKAHAEYGDFYQLYVEEILQGAAIGDTMLPVALNHFVNDPDMRSVQEEVERVLGDMEPQRRAFEAAFKRLAVLFPDSITPSVVAFNSGFNYGIFPTDSVLGFGVEWFIGQEHPVIGYLSPEIFPRYVKDRMVPEMLVPSAVKGWLLVHYARDTRGDDLLTNLVETGKVMALLDALLPDVEPHLKFAFTPAQLAWCEANELAIWQELVGKDMLFSRKPADIGRWMNDGPFTNGLPRESPGHIGEWIGHRMVKAYLKAEPRMDFARLFALDEPRAILKHYKPR